ncbi:hypothetical protein H5410_019887 [Solanum commersonii]|uniref:Uncharacterized protein n=1 Tax=Solanum commersonii TaxID=4109 RepID=A0A9J5ZCJ5_SOLCO|nr:hypothetical protein H5410_019887 [Solanum commersonii]
MTTMLRIDNRGGLTSPPYKAAEKITPVRKTITPLELRQREAFFASSATLRYWRLKRIGLFEAFRIHLHSRPIKTLS